MSNLEGKTGYAIDEELDFQPEPESQEAKLVREVSEKHGLTDSKLHTDLSIAQHREFCSEVADRFLNEHPNILNGENLRILQAAQVADHLISPLVESWNEKAPGQVDYTDLAQSARVFVANALAKGDGAAVHETLADLATWGGDSGSEHNGYAASGYTGKNLGEFKLLLAAANVEQLAAGASHETATMHLYGYQTMTTAMAAGLRDTTYSGAAIAEQLEFHADRNGNPTTVKAKLAQVEADLNKAFALVFAKDLDRHEGSNWPLAGQEQNPDPAAAEDNFDNNWKQPLLNAAQALDITRFDLRGPTNLDLRHDPNERLAQVTAAEIQLDNLKDPQLKAMADQVCEQLLYRALKESQDDSNTHLKQALHPAIYAAAASRIARADAVLEHLNR